MLAVLFVYKQFSSTSHTFLKQFPHQNRNLVSNQSYKQSVPSIAINGDGL